MNIIHCGDSFTYGIGCDVPQEQSYARLVSNAMGSPYVNLAKPAASHHAIYLQLLMALEQSPDLVILNTTSPDRIEWINTNAEVRRPLRADQLNFETLTETSYIQELPTYSPCINSDQIHGYLHVNRYTRESQQKLDKIVEYNTAILDSAIKLEYDIGLITLGLTKLKQKGIPCLVLASILYEPLSSLFDNIMKVDFFELSRRQPDSLETHHCSPQAHKEVADGVIQRIGMNII